MLSHALSCSRPEEWGGDSYPKGTPTLEVQRPKGTADVKIRYPENKSDE